MSAWLCFSIFNLIYFVSHLNPFAPLRFYVVLLILSFFCVAKLVRRYAMVGKLTQKSDVYYCCSFLAFFRKKTC